MASDCAPCPEAAEIVRHLVLEGQRWVCELWFVHTLDAMTTVSGGMQGPGCVFTKAAGLVGVGGRVLRTPE